MEPAIFGLIKRLGLLSGGLLTDIYRTTRFIVVFQMKNVTDSDGSITEINETALIVSTTELRASSAYIRDYTLIANTVCVLLLPTVIMLVSTVLMLR